MFRIPDKKDVWLRVGTPHKKTDIWVILCFIRSETSSIVVVARDTDVHIHTSTRYHVPRCDSKLGLKTEEVYHTIVEHLSIDQLN